QRHTTGGDSVLLFVRDVPLPSLSRLAAADRFRLGSGRRLLRDRAACARRAPTPGPRPTTTFPAPRRLVARTRCVHRRQRDPALYRLGCRLEADRRDPDRIRASSRLARLRIERARLFARLAQLRLVAPVP